RLRRGLRRGRHPRREGHRGAAGADEGRAGGDPRVRHGPAAGGDPRAVRGGDGAARAAPAGRRPVRRGAARPAMSGGGAARDLAEDYRGSGFGAGLGCGDAPALLVVDLVRAYLVDGSPLRAPVEDAAAASVALIGAALESWVTGQISRPRIRYRVVYG